jgi:hypothetical protein
MNVVQIVSPMGPRRTLANPASRGSSSRIRAPWCVSQAEIQRHRLEIQRSYRTPASRWPCIPNQESCIPPEYYHQSLFNLSYSHTLSWLFLIFTQLVHKFTYEPWRTISIKFTLDKSYLKNIAYLLNEHSI